MDCENLKMWCVIVVTTIIEIFFVLHRSIDVSLSNCTADSFTKDKCFRISFVAYFLNDIRSEQWVLTSIEKQLKYTEDDYLN